MQTLIEHNASMLRRIHEQMHETARHRSESAEARQKWEQACEEWHGRYDELAFPGGITAGLQKLEAGDLSAVETAIRYLELRPFFFGAQYQRNAFTKRLKRLDLPPHLKARFDATVERLRAWRRNKVGGSKRTEPP
jgi:hypothetical protein